MNIRTSFLNIIFKCVIVFLMAQTHKALTCVMYVRSVGGAGTLSLFTLGGEIVEDVIRSGFVWHLCLSCSTSDVQEKRGACRRRRLIRADDQAQQA